VARVVFITTSYPDSAGDPSGHFVEREASERARRGDTVIVLAPGSYALRTRDVTLIELPGGAAFGWPGALERLRDGPHRVLAACAFVIAACIRLRTLGAVDEIVAHWILPSGFPIACAGAGAIEVVLHGSDVRLLARLPERLRRAIVEYLIRRGARFRFVSQALLDDCLRVTTPDLLARASVAPCPIDTTGTPTREEARRRFGIETDERVAVVVGRLVAGKRPIEAVNMALARGADRIVVVGDGPLRDAIRKLDRRVVAVGLTPRATALAWIAAADYLVSASHLEGTSTVVREARALGVPVIAVPSGDLRDWARSDPGIELVGEEPLCDPSGSRDFAHPSRFVVLERLQDFLLGVHHERAIPRYGLANGRARE
jgi:glycosyltransferase involved in cell wall biosynthesis